jgi:hypothetical protein
MPALYWHVRYFQNDKEFIMSAAAEIMEAAGFNDPATGENEVSGAKGDVSGFTGWSGRGRDPTRSRPSGRS